METKKPKTQEHKLSAQLQTGSQLTHKPDTEQHMSWWSSLADHRSLSKSFLHLASV